MTKTLESSKQLNSPRLIFSRRQVLIDENDNLIKENEKLLARNLEIIYIQAAIGFISIVSLFLLENSIPIIIGLLAIFSLSFLRFFPNSNRVSENLTKIKINISKTRKMIKNDILGTWDTARAFEKLIQQKTRVKQK